MKDRVKSLRRVRAADIEGAPWNWRRHPERQRQAVAASIEELGFYEPLLVYETAAGRLRLVDGHLRRELVEGTGPETKVPVIVTTLSEAEAKLATLTHDPLAAMAEAEDSILAELSGQVESEQAALRELIADLAGVEARDESGGSFAVDPDHVPQPHKKIKTKPGDMWLLGDHRLICGDATDSGCVAALMNGERAGLMNTDPPYGVGYANAERPNPGVAKPRVANDDLSDATLQSFLEAAFQAATAEALAQNAAWYLWHAHLTQGFFAAAAAAAAAANVVLHRQIIWVKPVLLLGRGQYHWKHEPSFMGWVKGHPPPDYGAGNNEQNQTTVWELPTVSRVDRREFNHATPKPVALFEIPIVKHLRAGEIAFDPFAGTGPQVIAAEMHGRRCFAIEIEPAYCDVIVERWQQFTGKTASWC